MGKQYIAKEGLLHHGVWRELDADGTVIAEHGKLPIPAGTRFELVDSELRGQHKKLVRAVKVKAEPDEVAVGLGPDEMDDLAPHKKLRDAGAGNGGPPKKKGGR